MAVDSCQNNFNSSMTTFILKAVILYCDLSKNYKGDFFMAYKILVAEDDESIANIVQLTLNLEAHETVLADDGQKAAEFIQKEALDLAILNIMLPFLDGYQLLELLHKKNIPAIFLSAKADVSDRVKGLRLGAYDYITKPFETIELLARVDAVLRRTGKKTEEIKAGDVVLYLDKHLVQKNGKTVDLTPLEYDLLEKLMKNQGLLFSRDHLLDIVWGYEYAGSTRTVDTHIQKLRSKLNLGDYIKTVHKIGYKFEVQLNGTEN